MVSDLDLTQRVAWVADNRCPLALLRDAWPAHDIGVEWRADGTALVLIRLPGSPHHRAYAGDSMAEALTRALEAAPAAKGGQ